MPIFQNQISGCYLLACVAVEIVGFPLANQSHWGSEERHLVEIDKEHRDASVDAEGSDPRQRGASSDDERQDRCEVCDCDRDSSLREGTSHTLLYREKETELSPCCYHDKHIVNPNT